MREAEAVDVFKNKDIYYVKDIEEEVLSCNE